LEIFGASPRRGSGNMKKWHGEKCRRGIEESYNMISQKESVKDEFRQNFFKIKEIGGEKLVVLEDERGYLRIWLPKEQLEPFLEKIGRG
jgi:hypothetical protein